MRAITITVLAALVLLPSALSLEYHRYDIPNPDDSVGGGSGGGSAGSPPAQATAAPSDDYLNPQTGTHDYYNASTGLFTPDPTAQGSTDAFTNGIQVSYAYGNQTMPNMTSITATCPATAWFCIGYNVRLEGNWTVAWSYTVNEYFPDTGWRAISASNQMSFGLGQPLVTGGDLYKSFNHGSTATNCVVDAQLRATHPILSPRNTEKVFQCVP